MSANAHSREHDAIAAKCSEFQKQIPTGAWDSHVHVIDPTRYPIAANAQYQPQTHTLSDAEAFEQSINVQKIVLVQPSIYGTDNACLLAALGALGPSRAAGVVVCDPASTCADQMREWHAAGVRGVRVNVQSVGAKPDPAVFAGELQKYADLVRPYDWVLDLFLPMSMLPLVEEISPTLGVKICLDHFACPALPKGEAHDGHLSKTADPNSIEGFSSLLRLLEGRKTWVKISAAYRLAEGDYHKALLKVLTLAMSKSAPDRLVWASDWPHTRFSGLDIRPFITDCLEWCGEDENVRARMFRDNAIELWG